MDFFRSCVNLQFSYMGCKIPQVYDQNFYWGGGGGIGVVDGVGG